MAVQEIAMGELLWKNMALPLGKWLACYYFRGIYAGLTKTGIELTAEKVAAAKDRNVYQRHFEDLGMHIVDKVKVLFDDAIRRNQVNCKAVIHKLGVVLSSELLIQRFIENDLNEQQISEQIHREHPLPAGQFNEAEESLYRRVLDETVSYLVNIAREFPEYQDTRDRIVLERFTQLMCDIKIILDKVEVILKRLPGDDQDDAAKCVLRYEVSYRQSVVNRYNEIELFGADLKSPPSRRYSFSVAYTPLQVSSKSETEKASEHSASDFKTIVDNLHEHGRRLLIRGEAGSGKSTLFQWVAIQAASETPGNDGQDDWRQRIPFLLRLRKYQDGEMPGLSSYTSDYKALHNPPDRWVHQVLDDGRAVILLDGVDEIPQFRRNNVFQWLKELTNQYPHNYYLVSTRPKAVEHGWLKELGFQEAEIQPMNEFGRNDFIRQWHEAVKEQFRFQALQLPEHFDSLSDKLKQAFESGENYLISKLATNPLLCAMICALHLDENRHAEQQQQGLPQNYCQLCEKLCVLMLDKRDRTRGVHADKKFEAYCRMRYEQKKAVVTELAHYMVRNGLSTMVTSDADEKIASVLESLGYEACRAGEVRELIIERSGILRESAPGLIEFIHNTFKEYLAGMRYAADKDDGALADFAFDDDRQNVILFALGTESIEFASRVIYQILKPKKTWWSRLSGKDPSLRARQLFAVKCKHLALHLNDEALRNELAQIEREVIPPRNLEDARSLSYGGDFVVDYLSYNSKWTAKEQVASVLTLNLINTARAQTCLRGCLVSDTEGVQETLAGLPEVHSMVVNGEEIPEPVRMKLPAIFRKAKVTQPGVMDLSAADIQDQDLEPLPKIRGLRKLIMSDTEVADISSLATIDGLEEIDLDRTRVTEIPVFLNSQSVVVHWDYYRNSLGMLFRRIESGRFMMGGTVRDEQPVHEVTLQAFEIGVMPVTQSQYEAVMGDNPSHFKGEGHPVENVSWADAMAFCRRLTDMDKQGRKYSLPSEAQWEYACRAGSTTEYCFGDDPGEIEEYAWYIKNSGGKTLPVGKKKPNAWGLYDMHGNVWEWCFDHWHDNYKGAPDDGSAWVEKDDGGRLRVVRGGSWRYDASRCRSAYRLNARPELRGSSLGFRVLAVPAEKSKG